MDRLLDKILASQLRRQRRKIVGLIRARGRGMSVAIFIDTNQYLKLYGVVEGNGKALLATLEEQKDHIFVSTQIVDEVMGNKLGYARKFFTEQINEIETERTTVPDHLLGISDEKVRHFRSIFESAKGAADKAKKEIRDRGAEVLSLISRSKDDVSVRLATLFASAVEANAYEMAGARARREHGNPPGYIRDPLGDQIVWEQLLSYCKKIHVKRLWIVSEDSDYVTKFGKLVLLNPFLTQELMQACGDEVEIRCFDNAMTALLDFAKDPGVTAKKLPTEEKAKEIEKELQSLPPFVQRSWDDGTQIAIRAHWAKEGALGTGYYDHLGNRPLPLAAISTPEKDEGGQ